MKGAGCEDLAPFLVWERVMTEGIPDPWKEHLRELLENDRGSFVERMEFLEEDSQEGYESALRFLGNNHYELYLRFKENADEQVEELLFMKSLLITNTPISRDDQ